MTQSEIFIRYSFKGLELTSDRNTQNTLYVSCQKAQQQHTLKPFRSLFKKSKGGGDFLPKITWAWLIFNPSLKNSNFWLNAQFLTSKCPTTTAYNFTYKKGSGKAWFLNVPYILPTGYK